MKASWRDSTEQLPKDDRLVIGCFLRGEYRICYFDGDDWYDTDTDNVIKEPLFWMYIPEVPFVL